MSNPSKTKVIKPVSEATVKRRLVKEQCLKAAGSAFYTPVNLSELEKVEDSTGSSGWIGIELQCWGMTQEASQVWIYDKKSLLEMIQNEFDFKPVRSSTLAMRFGQFLISAMNASAWGPHLRVDTLYREEYAVAQWDVGLDETMHMVTVSVRGPELTKKSWDALHRWVDAGLCKHMPKTKPSVFYRQKRRGLHQYEMRNLFQNFVPKWR